MRGQTEGARDMSFTFNEYLRLISDQKFNEAYEYRCINVPKTLFKYFRLIDNQLCQESTTYSCEKIKEKNERKFQALEDNVLWMPTYNNLNDPFEFKALYLNKQSLKDEGWQISELEGLLKGIKGLFLLASFSQNLTNNIPMWAHYANNHKGFCVEYRIANPKYLYPISYETERMAIASSITKMISKFSSYGEKAIPENDPELRLYFNIMYHMTIMKHKSWEYENEYRAIYYNLTGQKSGNKVLLSDLGLEVARIYVGADCTVEHRKRLLHIAMKLNCEINEMYLDEYEPSFELRYQELSLSDGLTPYKFN
ncbi:MAG TPA: DUF2971 domain-containing protein [Desulfosporosinus sp.]